MKHVRKALALMLAMFVSLVIAAPAFAAGTGQFTYVGSGETSGQNNPGKITISNAEEETYYLFRLFEATIDQANPSKINYKISASQRTALTQASPDVQAFFAKYFTLTPVNSASPNGDAWVTSVDPEAVKVSEFDAADPDNPELGGATKDGIWGDLATAIGERIRANDANGQDTYPVNNATTKYDQIEWLNLPYGWYYISTTTGSLVTIDSTNAEATVIDKNTVTNIDKVQIKKSLDDQGNVTGTTEVKEMAEFLQNPIDFKLTAAGENYQTGKPVYHYIVEDEMDEGFTITTVPTVKVAGNTLTAGTDYEIKYYAGGWDAADEKTEAEAKNGEADRFRITILWMNNSMTTEEEKIAAEKNPSFIYNNEDPILVEYSAKLDETKVEDGKVNFGKHPNVNTGRINWDHPKSQPTVPDGGWPETETKTYTTGLEIIKKDNANKPLAGAEFTLTQTKGNGKVVVTVGEKYTADAQGTYYKVLTGRGGYTDVAPTPSQINNGDFELDSSGNPVTYRLDPVYDIKGSGNFADVKVVTGQDGTAKFLGLGEGEYKLEETVVPDGFIKWEGMEFNVVFVPGTPAAAGTPAVAATFEANEKTDTGFDKPLALDGGENVFQKTITNVPGTEFPETGGMGTRILYTVGGLMVAGAAIYLITKKRMASEA